MTLALQQLQADYDKLKQEESDKSSKLQELMSVILRPSRSLKKVENCALYDDQKSSIGVSSEFSSNKIENRALYDDKKSSIETLPEYSFNKIEMEKREKDLSNIIRSGSNSKDDKEMNTVVESSPNRLPYLPFALHFLISTAVILFSRRSPHTIIVQNFY